MSAHYTFTVSSSEKSPFSFVLSQRQAQEASFFFQEPGLISQKAMPQMEKNTDSTTVIQG